MSILNFTVVGEPVSIIDPKTKEPKIVPNKKALVRTDNRDVLEIVGKKYKIIQNHEVFNAVDKHVANSIGSKHFSNAKIIESMSHGGQKCLRDYRFPDIKLQSIDKSKADVAFRIVVVNAFGLSAIKLYAGAIDFFCLNGMIVGDYSIASVRHSPRARIETAVAPVVTEALAAFHKQKDIWQKWQKKQVDRDKVVKFLKKNIESKTLQDSLVARIMHEYAERGQTMWAVYSALTYYASHNKGEFSTSERSTGNEASIMFKRENKVNNLVTSPEWASIAKAA